jgi:hypothetical protein
MKKIHFMNAKILLIVILLVTGISLNAQVVDKETTLTEVMSNIWSEQDEFSQITRYYSKKTPKNQNDFYDRFFLYISVPKNNGVPRLFLEISHSDQYRRGDYYRIKTISLLSDGKPLDLPMNQGTISGNGSQQSIFTMGFGKKPYYFDYIKDMVNAQSTKARIVTPKNLQIDFEISAKERKAISEVLALWELMKK